MLPYLAASGNEWAIFYEINVLLNVNTSYPLPLLFLYEFFRKTKDVILETNRAGFSSPVLSLCGDATGISPLMYPLTSYILPCVLTLTSDQNFQDRS